MSLAQGLDKTPAIELIVEDLLTPVASIQHMINRPGKLDARFSCHLVAKANRPCISPSRAKFYS
jgi:hypothetical protein